MIITLQLIIDKQKRRRRKTIYKPRNYKYQERIVIEATKNACRVTFDSQLPDWQGPRQAICQASHLPIKSLKEQSKTCWARKTLELLVSRASWNVHVFFFSSPVVNEEYLEL